VVGGCYRGADEVGWGSAGIVQLKGIHMPLSEKAVAAKVMGPILCLLAYILSLTGHLTSMQRLYDAVMLSPLAVVGLWLIIVPVEIRVSLGDNNVTAINYWRRVRIDHAKIVRIERRFIGFDSVILLSGKRLFYVRSSEDDLLRMLFDKSKDRPAA
jgi:hypothetical protein